MNDADNLILKISALEKTYVTGSENLTILKDLDMSVSRGTKCVIVGESGSGKSTLLNIIAGLDSVTGGSVCVNGKDVAKMNERSLPEFRRSVLGLIFQFHYLLKDFTALENVFLPAYMAGVPKRAAMEKAKSLLNDVGLSSRAEHLPSQLSGGERQRVAVARSLVNDPELILADEPTGNLDPANAALIGNLLFTMAEKYNKTLLLVTHDMTLASRGDIKYRIESGRLSEAF
ncbi:ABC transporter ATP-binding protein [uncultured Treponema sp.]|uniref:ABC transporter ATP-binding protein n=1 Tax=uncultured Treponema sp. TaxID=162155 RepID=UPI0025972E24|nr:ABC transporter ATP-binding protein [uncultured Treponema sp.]